MTLTGLSLFSGAGGMDIGFKAAGVDVLWANDFDRSACDTYEANSLGEIEHGDINDFIPGLKKYAGEIDVVFGGPPCQGFSVAGKMDPNDERSQLVWSFLKVVELIKPKAFVMENVKALGVNARWSDFRQELISKFQSLGYDVKQTVLTASDYGVPQKRERVFFVGLRNTNNVASAFDEFLSSYKLPARTVRDAIGHLGRPGSKGNDLVCKAGITLATKPVLRKSPYAGMLFNGSGRPLNLEAPSTTMSASMGGNKTHIVDQSLIEDPLAHNWIHEYHAHLLNGGEPYNWKSAPEQLRRLTANEALLLQTFPEDFVLKCSRSAAFRLIGNAVPCDLAKAVALAVTDLIMLDSQQIKEIQNGKYLFDDLLLPKSNEVQAA